MVNHKGQSMPRRPRSHQVEDLSRDKARYAFNTMGWTVEDLKKDYGEDLLVRIFEDGAASPLMFFVQCKGTDAAQNYTSRGRPGLKFPIKKRHLGHWDRFAEPVILLVWDSTSDRMYWECVQSYFASRTGKFALRKTNNAKSGTIRIPVTNLLDRAGLRRIESIARIQFERLESEKKGGEILVKMLEKHLKARIEYNPKAGIVWLESHGKSPTITAFGRFVETLEVVGQHLGCPPEEAMNKGLNVLRHWVESLSDKKKASFLAILQRAAMWEQRGEDVVTFLSEELGATSWSHSSG